MQIREDWSDVPHFTALVFYEQGKTYFLVKLRSQNSTRSVHGHYSYRLELDPDPSQIKKNASAPRTVSERNLTASSKDVTEFFRVSLKLPLSFKKQN
jgi:hypothetical protein